MIDGAQQPVRIEILFGPEADPRMNDELRHIMPGIQPECPDIRGAQPYVFICPQYSLHTFRPGVDHRAVRECRCIRRDILLADAVDAQVLIHLFESFIIFCDSDIELLCIIAKIYAYRRLDPILRCQPEKVQYARCIVDVGQCQLGDTRLAGIQEQILRLHHAVVETVATMAIDVHSCSVYMCLWAPGTGGSPVQGSQTPRLR